MNFTLKTIALAMLVATVQPTGVTFAQAPRAPALTAVRPAAQSAPAGTKAPEDWIIYDDITYTPVVDSVSKHLDAARKAIGAKGVAGGHARWEGRQGFVLPLEWKVQGMTFSGALAGAQRTMD